MAGSIELGTRALDLLIDDERFVNDGSPNRRSFTDAVSVPTSPRLSPGRVLLPILSLDNPVDVFGDRSAFDRMGLATCDILVHPDVAPYLRDDNLERLARTSRYVLARPTAAGRVLLVDGDPRPVFVKLAYPGRLGRYSASLTQRKIRSGEVALRCLRSAMQCQVKGCAVSHGFIDDQGAIAADGFASVQDFGSIVAIARAAEVAHSTTAVTCSRIMPYFSLTSLHGRRDPVGYGAQGLVEALRLSGLDQDTFLHDVVVGRLIESMGCLLLHHGLIPEPHGQNLLLAYCKDENGDRILFPVWRDAQSWYLLRDRMTVVDSERVGRYPATGTEREAVSGQLDDMFWTHLVAPILAVAGSIGCDPIRVFVTARDRFRRTFVDGDQGVLPEGHWWTRSSNLPLEGERLSLIRVRGDGPLRGPLMAVSTKSKKEPRT